MTKKKQTSLPHSHLKDLLPSFLRGLQFRCEDRAERKTEDVLAYWHQVINPDWASMTRPISFEKGIIVVHVKNSALYSILVQHEGAQILKKLQHQFPQSGINRLTFRIG
ncbi:MAG: DUF721 domain-containing protein [Candidatus Rhabdochlamydia sp.]